MSFWNLNRSIHHHCTTTSSKSFTHFLFCGKTVFFFFIEAVGAWLKWSPMPKDEHLIQSINLISRRNIMQQMVQSFSEQRSPNGGMQIRLIWKYIDKRVTKFGERQIIEQGRKSITSTTDFMLEKWYDGEATGRVEEKRYNGGNDRWWDW